MKTLFKSAQATITQERKRKSDKEMKLLQFSSHFQLVQVWITRDILNKLLFNRFFLQHEKGKPSSSSNA